MHATSILTCCYPVSLAISLPFFLALCVCYVLLLHIYATLHTHTHARTHAYSAALNAIVVRTNTPRGAAAWSRSLRHATQLTSSAPRQTRRAFLSLSLSLARIQAHTLRAVSASRQEVRWAAGVERPPAALSSGAEQTNVHTRARPASRCASPSRSCRHHLLARGRGNSPTEAYRRPPHPTCDL